MQETICNFEIFQEDDGSFSAILRTEIGGSIEYTGLTIDEIINQVVRELEDEFS
ncbi:hypothetical protein [Caldiplasma sukawensis]